MGCKLVKTTLMSYFLISKVVLERDLVIEMKEEGERFRPAAERISSSKSRVI